MSVERPLIQLQEVSEGQHDWCARVECECELVVIGERRGVGMGDGSGWIKNSVGRAVRYF